MSAWFKPMLSVLIAAKHWRHSAPLETALPDQLMGEVEWLRAQADSVLIFGDIPPAAAELADRVDAPLVWMSNFGWDDIYRPLGGRLSAGPMQPWLNTNEDSCCCGVPLICR
jgi:hypothetical protein